MERVIHTRVLTSLLLYGLLLLAALPARADTTRLTQGDNTSNLTVVDRAISADGRHVAFRSSAGNLVAGDTNGKHAVFVRDTTTGATTRVSVDDSGTQGNGDRSSPSISADGSAVAFSSQATNLDEGSGLQEVFICRCVQAGR